VFMCVCVCVCVVCVCVCVCVLARVRSYARQMGASLGIIRGTSARPQLSLMPSFLLHTYTHTHTHHTDPQLARSNLMPTRNPAHSPTYAGLPPPPKTKSACSYGPPLSAPNFTLRLHRAGRRPTHRIA
jgi:hypothetical protein